MGPGSVLVAARALPGGSSHVNHAIDIRDRDGHLVQLVLRRWARRGWELADPDLTAEREVSILQILAKTSVPAPRLVAADTAAAECDVASLLITRLPGSPPERTSCGEPYLDQLAAMLALIHSVDGRVAADVPSYSRYFEPHEVALPPGLRGSDVWETAVRVVGEAPPPGPTRFIHRDYHPGNTLWSGGRLTGVVDWTQGSWGPASVDVGHMRWNLAAACGPETSDGFLERYRIHGEGAFRHDPYWDVVTLVDLVADVDSTSRLPQREMARLERYLAGVLAGL